MATNITRTEKPVEAHIGFAQHIVELAAAEEQRPVSLAAQK